MQQGRRGKVFKENGSQKEGGLDREQSLKVNGPVIFSFGASWESQDCGEPSPSIYIHNVGINGMI